MKQSYLMGIFKYPFEPRMITAGRPTLSSPIICLCVPLPKSCFLDIRTLKDELLNGAILTSGVIFGSDLPRIGQWAVIITMGLHCGMQQFPTLPACLYDYPTSELVCCLYSERL
ncbi:hypothetical protein ElyMa_005285000 [Elysia marginata]|uniref:Uncharacterized protein n=1 Tax=Elysia marginata TaxID=1093978 RepID=A0AAV4JZ89_9GAST|nr:hypothetical protein ElyMa_005285000 [Elysia marginata]